MSDDEKIQNPKVQVECGIEMNDCDILNTILTLEKGMSSSLATALNEASNLDLYEEFLEFYTGVSTAAKDLFELSFKNGWYSLKKADTAEINTKYDELINKLSEIQV
ncbi:MAG: spore coat protein [Bacilli bacterium]